MSELTPAERKQIVDQVISTVLNEDAELMTRLEGN